VQEHELVDGALAHEVGDDAVDARLHVLLPDEAIASAVEGHVEQLPARGEAARRLHFLGAEVIEDVLQILRDVAGILLGPRDEEVEELVERHDALVARVAVADFLTDLRQRVLAGLAIVTRGHAPILAL